MRSIDQIDRDIQLGRTVSPAERLRWRRWKKQQEFLTDTDSYLDGDYGPGKEWGANKDRIGD